MPLGCAVEPPLQQLPSLLGDLSKGGGLFQVHYCNLVERVALFQGLFVPFCDLVEKVVPVLGVGSMRGFHIY